MLFDPQLKMELATREVAARACDKLRMLLRSRRFHSTASLILLYKAHVLSILEFCTPAVYHAPGFFLSALDRVQEAFLSALGLTEEEALVHFRLAPLCARRDLCMLGLVRRTVLGEAPDHFKKFFHQAPVDLRAPRSWCAAAARHDKQ